MKKHHMEHHYKTPDLGFGVTSKICKLFSPFLQLSLSLSLSLSCWYWIGMVADAVDSGDWVFGTDFV